MARVEPSGAFARVPMLRFLAARGLAGVEQIAVPANEAGAGEYARTVRLPHGHACIRMGVAPGPSARVEIDGWLADARDRDEAAMRAGWVLDLDTDLAAVDEVLARDPVLARGVAQVPGLRVPGHVDAFEIAVRAVVGQQISVAGARTVLGRLVERHGDDLDRTVAEVLPSALRPLCRLFPTPEALAAADPDLLPMPRARGRALVGLAGAVASGTLVLDRAATSSDELPELRSALLSLPGIGPWTADYVLLRAFGARDVFLAGDLGVRQGLASLGVTAARSQSWAPFRSYAMMHVWAAPGRVPA